MHIREIVAADTQNMVRAVMAARPSHHVANAAQDNFRADTFVSSGSFTPAMGGFIGGTLFNMTTAAFLQMRLLGNGKVTNEAVDPISKPRSSIGKKLLSLLNNAHEPHLDLPPAPNTLLKPGSSFDMSAKFEGGFLAHTGNHRATPTKPDVVLNRYGDIAIYGDLIVDPYGIPASNVVTPDGVITGYTGANPSRLQQRSRRLIAGDELATLSPMRFALFDIPPNERVATFMPPASFGKLPWDTHKLENAPTQMALFNQLAALNQNLPRVAA